MKKKSPRVLIVEDNPESIDLLVYFLKPAGYETITATDGVMALEMIAQELPDIILLDVMLPKMNGFQVCERLKKDERTIHIPIIMITALKELKDKIRALEAGADDFISKPFDSVELLTRVKSLLRIKFYQDELKRRNWELEKQKQYLEREDVLKKELTNLIVHDMKSPLFVIQGNLQMMHMMRERGQLQNDEKYTQRIERSSRGLLRMILSLLDISRLEQDTMDIEPVPVNLKQMVKETVAYFRDLPENKNKHIEFNFSQDIPAPYVDKNLLERILDNLFNFIFKNAHDKANIVIKTESAAHDCIYLRTHYDGKQIPRQFHEKIFTKFAQNELKHAGFKPARGLGLIFCKLAIEANGGTIRVDPEFENGTGFILKLPGWIKNSTSRPEELSV